VKSDLPKVKTELARLPEISRDAIVAFQNALPKLVYLVDEKFSVENKLGESIAAQSQLDLIKDAHKNFGNVLSAIYQFQLYPALADEFAWLISTLVSRGLTREYFTRMLNAWIFAIHGIIETRWARELVRPLQVLEQNLTELIEHSAVLTQPETESQRKLLLLLLEKKRRAAADYVMTLAGKSVQIEELCTNLLIPVLEKIGILWQKNEISVADEHAATEIGRYIMYRLCDSIAREKPLSYKALVTCVPGEEHDLGAEMVAGFLENKGWNVYFLGRSLPELDILLTVEKDKFEAIFLSVTLVANLPTTVALMRKIRETAPKAKIIIGGRAAILAIDTIQKQADAIVNDIKQVNPTALKLIQKDA